MAPILNGYTESRHKQVEFPNSPPSVIIVIYKGRVVILTCRASSLRFTVTSSLLLNRGLGAKRFPFEASNWSNSSLVAALKAVDDLCHVCAVGT